MIMVTVIVMYAVMSNPVPVWNDNYYDDVDNGIGDHVDGDQVLLGHFQPCPRLQ